MGARRKAREIAMQLLYQLEVNPGERQEAIELFWKGISASQPVKEFVNRIVEGVHVRQEEIDKLLARHSEHWRLDRMDMVDKSILRMAVFEIMYRQEVRGGRIGRLYQRYPGQDQQGRRKDLISQGEVYTVW